MPPVREDGSFEEHLLGGGVDDVVLTEDEARQTIDRSLLGGTGRVAIVVLVVGVVQVDVAVAVDAKVGVEGRAAEPTLDVGAELGDGQGLGLAGNSAVDRVEVLGDPEDAALFGDQHRAAVGTDLQVDGRIGIVEGDEEFLVKVGQEGRIDSWGLGQCGRWKKERDKEDAENCRGERYGTGT